jgi:hypothetical protein
LAARGSKGNSINTAAFYWMKSMARVQATPCFVSKTASNNETTTPAGMQPAGA